MKKQILSLVLLVAVLGSVSLAFAQGEDFRALQQTGVVDNLATRSAGYGDCTLEELTNGSCVKMIPGMSMLSTTVNTSKGVRFVISLVSGHCQNQTEVTTPGQNRMRLYESLEFSEGGRYVIANDTPEICSYKIQIIR